MSNIVLKRLKFDNMFSYGDNNTLDLHKSNITQLVAPNGNGKTSIALIVQELLYSKNVKKIKKPDILNRYIEDKEWSGFLEFSVADKEYSVQVTRKNNSSKVKLLQNGSDISQHQIPETYKLIEEILGMNFTIFSQLTYQSLKDTLEFLNATDSNRKKFLINLFNLQKYLDIWEVLKSSLLEIEKEEKIKTGELISIDNFLSETVIPEIKELLPKAEINDKLIKEKEQTQVVLSSQKELSSKIDKNNLYIQERNSINFDVSLKKPEKSLELDEINLTRESIAVARSKINKILHSLQSVDTSDTCYACGQTIDNSHSLIMKEGLLKEQQELEQTVKSLNDKLNRLTQLKNTYQKDLDVYQNNLAKIQKFEQLSQLIDTNLPSEHPDYNELEKRVRFLNSEIEIERKKEQETERLNEQIKENNYKAQTLRQQKREFLARKHLLEEELNKLRKSIFNLGILKKAFSPSGIVAFKLENLTQDLEDAINKYLLHLSDGQFQVIFRLEKEKLNILVLNESKESAIETISGGELSRVQTAVLLAIRHVLSKIGKNNINLLFLDEITGVLDDIGKEKLLETLQEEENMNIFLISHDFSHPTLETLYIQKEEKISSIEGEY